jgi:hypothetical protein
MRSPGDGNSAVGALPSFRGWVGLGLGGQSLVAVDGGPVACGVGVGVGVGVTRQGFWCVV